LLEALQESFTCWSWPKLEDLTSVACLLDRFDDLLAEGIADGFNENAIGTALDKTSIILRNSGNHTLYSSVDRLMEILDCDSWSLIHKVLSILHLLVNRVTPTIRSTKAHRNSDLSNKLYALAIGDLLNNP
jgi:hypothetical protein